MHRFKLVVAYLGSPFHGWQRQASQRTVQGELEHALVDLTGAGSVAVVGAGRTDAGVHAAGQVAHVDLAAAIPPAGLVRGLNRLLPPEIRIRAAVAATPAFHARKSARAKLYTYRARWQASPYPWRQLRAGVVAAVDRWDEVHRAATQLEGRHDWASFTVTNPGTPSTVRTLYQVRVRSRRDGVDFHFVGDGFLRYQVRRLVGALLAIGSGREQPGWLTDLIRHPQPGAKIVTAAPGGLTLERVYYRRTDVTTNGFPEAPFDRSGATTPGDGANPEGA